MHVVMMAEEPQSIEITARKDGLFNVYLRKNIKQTEDGWEAEEVRLSGKYSASDIEEHFEKYWADGVKATMTQDERFSEIEAVQADQDAAICDLYEMMIGDDE